MRKQKYTPYPFNCFRWRKCNMSILTRFFTLIFIQLFTFSLASANRGVGNGGFGVYCSKTKKTWVLDAYEARALGTIKLGSPKLSIDEKVMMALKSLGKFSPYALKNYSERYENFKSYIKRVPHPIKDTEDIGEYNLEDGCEPIQIGAQYSSGKPSGREYKINQKYWDKLDNDNRAILYLHEILLSTQSVNFNPGERKFEKLTSQATRDFVGHLVTGKIDLMSQKELFSYLSNLTEEPRLAYSFYFGIPFISSGLEKRLNEKAYCPDEGYYSLPLETNPQIKNLLSVTLDVGATGNRGAYLSFKHKEDDSIVVSHLTGAVKDLSLSIENETQEIEYIYATNSIKDLTRLFVTNDEDVFSIFTVKKPFLYNFEGGQLANVRNFSLDANGNIDCIFDTGEYDISIKYNGKDLNLSSERLCFQNHRLKSGILKLPVEFEFGEQKIRLEGPIQFHTNGIPQVGFAKLGGLTYPNGERRLFMSGYILFSEIGKLLDTRNEIWVGK